MIYVLTSYKSATNKHKKQNKTEKKRKISENKHVW